jgi:hypothetical protein
MTSDPRAEELLREAHLSLLEFQVRLAPSYGGKVPLRWKDLTNRIRAYLDGLA